MNKRLEATSFILLLCRIAQSLSASSLVHSFEHLTHECRSVCSDRSLFALHLRGGGPKKAAPVIEKEPEGLEGMEVPEYVEPEGDRYEFHLLSRQLRQEFKDGTRQIDAPLLEKKTATTQIEQKGTAPVAFLEKYKRANRSLNPYAQAATEVKAQK